MTKQIRYHSFDFDGCLSNEVFAAQLQAACPEKQEKWVTQLSADEVNKAVIDSNIDLLSRIKESSLGRDEYVLVGSNRQDIFMDIGNGAKREPTGSVYPRVAAIADYLGATYDKFLVADIQSRHDFGSEHALIEASQAIRANGGYKDTVSVRELKNDGRFAELVDDKGKVSLLLAQMQKASMEHPENEIEFNFYEDRMDIIGDLQHYFRKYPDLVPKNVTMVLHGYSGPQPSDTEQTQRHLEVYPYGSPQLIEKIKGTGSIPQNKEEWTALWLSMRSITEKLALKDAIATAIKDNPQHADDGELITSIAQSKMEVNVSKYCTPQALLRDYHEKGMSLDKIPKLAQEHITKHFREMPIEHREDHHRNDVLKALFAQEVGHVKATGRLHAFSAVAENSMKDELKKLRGDDLKREVLLDFKNQLEKIESVAALEQFKKDHKETTEYRVLAKGQGLATRILGLDTDSVKALRAMINEKENALQEREGFNRPV